MDFQLSDRAQAVNNTAPSKFESLKSREKSLLFFGKVFMAITIFAMIVDVGVGMTFNTALLTNNVGELTFEDHTIRFVSSFGMVASFMAVVCCFHVASNKNVEIGKRILALIAGFALAFCVVFSAGAIGFKIFQSLLNQLWSGESASYAQSFGAEAEPPAEAAPLWLRMTSASLFIGVGVLAAISEVAWLVTRNKLAETQQKIAELQPTVDACIRYRANIKQHARLVEEQNASNDADALKIQATASVFDFIERYRLKVEKSRPPVVNPAQVDKSTWDSFAQRNKTADDNIQKLNAYVSNQGHIDDIVKKYFPA